ncbi:hypothetical protein BH20ACT23_BH20ACT23_30240 [soil metagenome]
MGFSVRVAKGVRISASSRGIRTSLGPRATRLHVGGGRPGISTGVGRYTYWTGLGGSKGPSKASPRTSVATHQTQLRAAERLEEIDRVRALEATIVSRHKEHFAPAQRPIAPEPEPVDTATIHRRARAQELSGVGFFRFSERRASKSRAKEIADGEIGKERAKRVARKKRLQVDLDEEWNKLNANDPETVMNTLEAAFEDNQDPAAPINCEEDSASVVILYPPQDFVPDKKPARTPTGKPILKRRNKTETSDLYARALASTTLATVKEAFAVAPGLERITIVVARKDPRAEDPEDYMAAIYAGTFLGTPACSGPTVIASFGPTCAVGRLTPSPL